jgi:hypothetical protein
MPGLGQNQSFASVRCRRAWLESVQRRSKVAPYHCLVHFCRVRSSSSRHFGVSKRTIRRIPEALPHVGSSVGRIHIH